MSRLAAATPAAPPPTTTTSTSLSGITNPSEQRLPTELIIYPQEIKPMWRCDLTATRAVARRERVGKIANTPLALADMDERADHRAHLMLQERPCRRGDVHIVAVAGNVEAVERFVRRFRLALGGAERREVMLADELLRSRMHRCAIERPRHAPGAVLRERQIGAAIDDAIEIVAFDRGKPRVEIR